jgi:TP901 family phage tail tape measure protein
LSTEITSLVVSFGADTKDFLKGLDDIDKSSNALSRTADMLGNAFKLAFGVGVAAAAGLTAVIGKSVSAAADMEQGVADIGATMVLSADQTQQLQDHIMDLGLDPNLKVSATEAAGAVLSLGQAGLDMEQILGGASKATVLLANATGLKGDSGFAAAANIATDVMQQFNISAGQMDAAVDQIAGTTIASKFTIDDYRLAIAQAGGVAGALGVEFDDFNAAIAATSSSFSSGSDAGTSFKRFLQTLNPVSNNAQDWMEHLGLFTKEAGSAFYDAAGNMKSMEEIAGLLNIALGGLSEAEKNEATSRIFGTDAMRTALALAEGGAPIIAKMKGAIGKVDAEELATKRMDTFKGAMEIAQGVIETISISIGNKFLPVLRPLVERFTELATTYGPALIAFFGQLAEGLAALISPMLDASFGTGGLFENLKGVGETVANVMEAVKLFVKPLTDAIAKFVNWKDVLRALGILLAGPVLGAIGAVISGIVGFLAPIAGLIAAVAALRYAWENDFMGIRTSTLTVLNNITDWFYTKSGIWKGTWEETLKYLTWWANGGWKNAIFFPLRSRLIEIGWEFNEFKMKAVNLFTEWKTKVVEIIAGWIEKTKHTFGDWRNKVMEIWNDWYGRVTNIIDDFIDINMTKFTTWKNNINGIVRDVKEWFIDKWQAVIDWWDRNIRPWVDRGRDIIQGLWDGVKEVWHRFTSWTGDTFRGWVNWFDDLFQFGSPSKIMIQRGQWLMEGLAQGIEDSSGLVADALGKASDDWIAPTTFSPGMSLLSALGTEKADSFIDDIKKMGVNAQKALEAGGVAKGNAAYAFADTLTKESAGSSIAKLFEDITGLVSQLNAKGVSGPKNNLLSMSDFLDKLTAGEMTTYAPPAEPSMGGGGELTEMVVDMLKSILVELRNNGLIDKQGFERLAAGMGRGSGSGDDYGAQTSFVAAGRR